MSSTKKILLSLIFLAAVIVGGFCYFTFRPHPNADYVTDVSELDKLLTLKVESTYPSTPREVLKMYNRYLVAIYNEDLNDSQIRTLLEKQRVFYDNGLLSVNSFDSNYTSRVNDIALYRKSQKSIVKSSVAASADVIYKEVDGESYAIMEASYFTRSGAADFTKTYERYLFRKDATGKWRILGFEKV